MPDIVWSIENLSRYPEWQSKVVAWQHSEWLRSFSDGNMSDDYIETVLAERKKSMAKHMDDNAIPSTFIAHNYQRPFGSVSLINYPGSREPERVWLTNLYVDFPFQGQGVGRALLLLGEQFACRHKVPELSLYTFDAKEYYLKHGWTWVSKGELHGRELDVLKKNIKKAPELGL